MPATKTKSVTLTFEREKETRRTWRFRETGDPDSHILGSIYVPKTVLAERLDDADTINVEVTPA